MLGHRVAQWAVVIVALVAIAAPGRAGEDCDPPPNEVCENAVPFSNTDLPFEVTAPLGCVNDEVDKPYYDVFYRFDCTRTGTYLIHMCGSSGDTYLRIYTEGCGWADGEELIVADDECPGSPPGADPLLLVVLEAGQSYWIEAGTWRPDPPWAPPLNSPYTLGVAFDAEPPGPAGSLDTNAGPESQLRIAKSGHEMLFSWGESCVADDTDYAIYEGQLETFGQHAPLTCSTGGATEYTASVSAGNAYFLITAHNEFVGGSYGTASGGAQRPKGNPVCLPRFIAECP